MKEIALFILLACSLCCLNACGGGEAHPETKPTVTISASPNTVAVGGSVALTWSSTNATSCTASSSPSETDWSGQVTTSGSQPVTPVSLGTTTYSLQCSGKAGNASKSASVVASIPPLAISGAPPDGTVGMRYDRRFERCQRGTPGCGCLTNDPQSCFREVFGFPLSATGGVAPYIWTWAAAPGSVLPPGLTLSGSTISGTPSLSGNYGIVITVTDSQSPAANMTASYTLTVNNPPAPSITRSTPSAGALNLPYVFSFSASGAAPLTWAESGTLPPGLAFGSNGALEGTPKKLGSYPIRVTVTDVAGQTASDDFTIEIFPHGFKATGSMADPREGHTATLLTNGKVLLAGGTDASMIFATAELFDPVSESFSSTGGMVTARYEHTATLLLSGKVLVAGGDTSTGATSELFDPASGTFTATGNMSTARTGHNATLLNSGKVLITGGTGAGGTTLATAELFDPASGTFSLTGTMASARIGHTATLLSNGKVLVTGGVDATGAALATAELFDPVNGTFAPTGSMATARHDHATILLTNGKVLVAGGMDTAGSILATAELFASSGGNFASTGTMNTARTGHKAVLLQDGTVLVTGGSDFNGQPLAVAELSTAAGASFAGTGSLTTPRVEHTSTLLNDGRVLVTGGRDSTDSVIKTAELYQ